MTEKKITTFSWGKNASAAACKILKKEATKAKKMKQKDKTLALVLDIDEASIMNTADETITTKNTYVFHLYKCALKLGYNVFFVTARGGQNKKSHRSVYDFTRKGLLKGGYKKYQKIYLQSSEQNYGDWFDEDTSIYKWSMRKKIADENDIVMAVGDNYWDLSKSEELNEKFSDLNKNYAIVQNYDDFAKYGWKVPSSEY